MAELSCIFQDQDIYAIHKPAGVPFHTLAQDSSNTAEGIVSLAKRFLNDEQIYPVHRLDKMTSGLMIFARHAEANRALSMALAARKVEKYYLGLSLIKPKKKQGAVIGDMQKSRSGSYKLSRDKANPAVTRFFARPIQLRSGDAAWLFALKPETGKTHQLRVAMKSLGSPILGDARYGGAPADRGYLHAYQIKFQLNGQTYELAAPDFSGTAFSLAEQSSNTLSDTALQDFFAPDLLPWPSSAFKLR